MSLWTSAGFDTSKFSKRHSRSQNPSLLRELTETSARGYAVDNEELAPGMMCADSISLALGASTAAS
jgi:DNA-binding IclR family transcriptional regulator